MYHLDTIEEATPDEHDIIILSMIAMGAPKQSLKNMKYMFHGTPVCREVFCFIHDISTAKLTRLRAYYREVGLSARLRRAPPPHNVTDLEVFKHVKSFIQTFSESFGNVMAGALPQHRNLSVILLPCICTKKEVWRKYSKACEEIGKEAVAYEQFRYFSLFFIGQ